MRTDKSKDVITEAKSALLTNIDGRRIVEMGELVRQLLDGCRQCGTELKLTKLIGEKLIGLASLMTIECHKCHSTNVIRSSKSHQTQNSKQVFDVNSKAALGK